MYASENYAIVDSYNGLFPLFGSKPLSQQMLSNCLFNTWEQISEIGI